MTTTQTIQSLCIGLWLAAALTAPVCAAPAAGDVAPNEVGRTLDGESVTLDSFAGKVVVVSFWATWCPYCQKELPVLDSIQKAAGNQHLQVIAVNTESRDVFRKVERALRSLSIKLAYDPGKQAATAYGVSAIPHLVIIGRDGRIVKVYRGYGESSLEGIVADLNRAVSMPAPVPQ
jgi:thiol-disulfide isomerase/thioredoxin